MSLSTGNIQENMTKDLYVALSEDIILLAFEFPLFWAFKLSAPHGNAGDSCDLKFLFPSAQRMDIANFPLREDKIK